MYTSFHANSEMHPEANGLQVEKKYMIIDNFKHDKNIWYLTCPSNMNSKFDKIYKRTVCQIFHNKHHHTMILEREEIIK